MIYRRDIGRNPERPIPIWRQKINPIWWFGDDAHPASVPYYSRRNFLMNFFAAVIGMECIDHEWFGTMPDTFPAKGLGCGVITLRWIALPYVCYRGLPFWWGHFFIAEIAVGWKPAGAFSVTIRQANATPA